MCKKNLRAGAPYTYLVCAGPTRGLPHPPSAFVRTLTISTLTILELTMRTLIVSIHTISTLCKPPSKCSLT